MRLKLSDIPWTTPMHGYPPEREYPKLPDLREEEAARSIRFHDRGWFVRHVGGVMDLILGFLLPACVVLPFVWVLSALVVSWLDGLLGALVGLI